MQQQQRQQRALLPSAQRDHAALVEDLERAENAEFHASRIPRAETPNLQQVRAAGHGSLPACYRRVTGPQPTRGTIATDVGSSSPPNGRAAEAIAPNKEAVMAQAIPMQHPAVVLRSRYTQLRMLLAVAMIAVVGLTVAVVILAIEQGTRTTPTSAAAGAGHSAQPDFGVPSHVLEHGGAPVPDLRVAPLPAGRRYDGGREEGTRGIVAARAPSTRYDGGREEGSSGPGR
jgi:hypothetical protein